MNTETELIYARHDLHHLKGRTLNRLLSDMDSLKVGLSAIEGNNPRLHVLQDKVQRVIESMAREIEFLHL